jgi:hypothetical protein
MKVDLTHKEKCIVSTIFKENEYISDAEFLMNKFSSGKTSRVGVSEMPFEGSHKVNFYFTTGLLSENVYVCISDGDRAEISNLLFNFEFGDSHGICCKFGQAIKLDDSFYFEENGCVGVVMLRVSTVPFLPNFPDKIVFNDIEFNFLLSVFLDEKEYLQIKENGLEFLLGEFGKYNKNIYSVRQERKK